MKQVEKKENQRELLKKAVEEIDGVTLFRVDFLSGGKKLEFEIIATKPVWFEKEPDDIEANPSSAFAYLSKTYVESIFPELPSDQKYFSVSKKLMLKIIDAPSFRLNFYSSVEPKIEKGNLRYSQFFAVSENF